MINFVKKISFSVLLMVITISCGVKTQPDKVWNLRGKIIKLARNLKGIQYKYGGEDIEGFDCSGLVWYVYHCFGFEIPRTAKKQSKIKAKIKYKHAKPGDILVFKLKRRWHSGIYLKKNFFIHSPNKKKKVKEEYINSYWRSHLKVIISIIRE
jgi:cell wall-associated NlpC family hydrolase